MVNSDKNLKAVCATRVGFALLLLILLGWGSGISTPQQASAAGASWSFEPTSWDFGVLAPGEGRSDPKGFVLTNTGAVPLEPTLVTLTSAEESGFGLSDHCKSTLAPAASCEVDVTFRATTPGPRTATLEVSERNSSVPPAVVNLTATAALPTITVEPKALTFGSTHLGSLSQPAQVVTMINHGPSDVTISDVALLPSPGDGHPPFSLTRFGCWIATELAPGQSCTFSVDFNPRVVGTEVGELKIVDNAADSPQTVEISGAAEPELAPPALQVDRTPPSAAALTHRPGHRTKARNATFAFAPGDTITARYLCGLGGGPLLTWCRSPVRYRSLKPGRHLFRVRPVAGDGVAGPVLSYRWRIVR